ncbi:MAG: hypothetical protein KDK90_27700 [Leptospiraceae bacterium]|nr:hypothetical protein [Leptospiraceae bacterium]
MNLEFFGSCNELLSDGEHDIAELRKCKNCETIGCTTIHCKKFNFEMTEDHKLKCINCGEIYSNGY